MTTERTEDWHSGTSEHFRTANSTNIQVHQFPCLLWKASTKLNRYCPSSCFCITEASENQIEILWHSGENEFRKESVLFVTTSILVYIMATYSCAHPGAIHSPYILLEIVYCLRKIPVPLFPSDGSRISSQLKRNIEMKKEWTRSVKKKSADELRWRIISSMISRADFWHTAIGKVRTHYRSSPSSEKVRKRTTWLGDPQSPYNSAVNESCGHGY